MPRGSGRRLAEYLHQHTAQHGGDINVTHNRRKTWGNNRSLARPRANQPNRPGRRGMRITPSSTEVKPTYAKRQIKDKHMCIEMLFVPAVVSSREIGRGGTPRVRVDGLIVASNIGRGKQDFSRPEPDLDAILLATRESVESTSARVEILTVRTRMANLGSTTSVGVDLGVTVRRDGLAVGTPVSHHHSRVAGEGSAHPVWRLSSGMVQPGRVCNEIKFCLAS